MRRYMKVLASTSALSVQMVISNAAFADIQRLPENGATAPRGPAPCPVGAYCSSSPDGIYSGGGGSGGSNSFPENEATAPRPAPPPTTHVQDAARAYESFEPPCVRVGESPSVYVARTLSECVNHVKDRLTIVPWFTTKAAIAAEACKAGIAGWNARVVDPSSDEMC